MCYKRNGLEGQLFFCPFFLLEGNWPTEKIVVIDRVTFIKQMGSKVCRLAGFGHLLG